MTWLRPLIGAFVGYVLTVLLSFVVVLISDTLLPLLVVVGIVTGYLIALIAGKNGLVMAAVVALIFLILAAIEFVNGQGSPAPLTGLAPHVVQTLIWALPTPGLAIGGAIRAFQSGELRLSE